MQDRLGEPHDLTLLLRRLRHGDPHAEALVFEILAEELRRMACHFMRGQKGDHTLQVTALVNEVYIRLQGGRETDWEDRRQFLRMAAKAMRSVLVDHARGKQCLKRTPPGEQLSVNGVAVRNTREQIDLLALDETMSRLLGVDELAGRVVEYRFYLGLPMVDVARELGIPLRTAERKWRFARAYLHQRLQ